MPRAAAWIEHDVDTACWKYWKHWTKTGGLPAGEGYIFGQIGSIEVAEVEAEAETKGEL